MRLALVFAACLLSGCAAVVPVPATDDIDVLLVGEQHDAAGQARLQRQYIEGIAGRGLLGALVLEMAERGTSTAGLPANASEDQVRQALRWDAEAWPWARYRPAVMAAVAAGAPVLGANLPRSQLRTAMADASLDTLLPGPALKAQQQAIRQGHCGLLPEAQIGPMTRAQVARDREMARTLEAAVVRGKTVLLLAGAGHVLPDVGIPLHLAPSVSARSVVLTPEPSAKDHCAELRQRMNAKPAP